jgi:hypothetical protein
VASFLMAEATSGRVSVLRGEAHVDTAGLPSFSTVGTAVGSGGRGVCWSGSVWWGVGGGEQTAEGVSVWPVGGQPQGDAAGLSGDPGGHGDQVAAQGCTVPKLDVGPVTRCFSGQVRLLIDTG